jgi:hypothetical protein
MPLLINSNPPKLWFRVPGAGSTTMFNRVQSETPGGLQRRVGNEHHTLEEAMGAEDWDEHANLEFVVNLRNPFDWVQTLYAMCYRASAHWGPWVSESEYRHAKFKDDLVVFLENIKTPLDWVTVGGVLFPCTVVCVEDYCKGSERLNPTQPAHRKDFEITSELEAIIRRRFYRELSHYDRLDNK